MPDYSAKQRHGTEFGGTSQQNTVQPRDSWKTLSASEKLRLMKTTGQEGDPAAPARVRHMQGQSGEQPKSIWRRRQVPR